MKIAVFKTNSGETKYFDYELFAGENLYEFERFISAKFERFINEIPPSEISLQQRVLDLENKIKAMTLNNIFDRDRIFQTNKARKWLTDLSLELGKKWVTKEADRVCGSGTANPIFTDTATFIFPKDAIDVKCTFKIKE